MTVSLTRDQVREWDRRAIASGIPGIVLMENAARGIVELLHSLGVKGPVAVVCGKGNNGGDGFLVARLLHTASIPVHVELVCDPTTLHGDAALAYASLCECSVGCAADPEQRLLRLRQSDWIVDALLGTGTQGNVRAPFDQAIQQINHSGRRILSVDLPSGLDCDTGVPLGEAVRAMHTGTFVARKRGFDNPESTQFTGTVHVIDIGIDGNLASDMARTPPRQPSDAPDRLA